MLCRACPFECGVDRSQQLGVCRASDRIEVSQAQLHYWEEPPISGTRGSGTIFLTHCNLSCRFCQNHDISQSGRGQAVSLDRLAAMMLELQDVGAHNINLVSPTQYSDQLVSVLESVRPRLSIPVVWNSNGYEKVETIQRLEGLVQVFMPDLKYHSDELAASCSSAPRYFRFASQALLEMRRLAGPPRLKHGILEQGVLVRHLVLPGHADDSQKVLDWLHDAFEDSVLVSLMAQYYPVHRASELPGLNRRLSTAEYSQVRDRFVSLGLEGFAQELSSAAADYTPDFKGDGL